MTVYFIFGCRLLTLDLRNKCMYCETIRIGVWEIVMFWLRFRPLHNNNEWVCIVYMPNP